MTVTVVTFDSSGGEATRISALAVQSLRKAEAEAAAVVTRCETLVAESELAVEFVTKTREEIVKLESTQESALRELLDDGVQVARPASLPSPALEKYVLRLDENRRRLASAQEMRRVYEGKVSHMVGVINRVAADKLVASSVVNRIQSHIDVIKASDGAQVRVEGGGLEVGREGRACNMLVLRAMRMRTVTHARAELSIVTCVPLRLCDMEWGGENTKN